MQTIAYLDCHMGIHGALLLEALVNAGLPLPVLREHLAALPYTDYQLTQGTTNIENSPGVRLLLQYPPQEHCPLQFADVLGLIQTSPLPDPIRHTALSIVQLLSSSLSTMPEQTVLLASLHPAQVLLESVGVAIGLEILHISQLYASPLPLPTGLTQTPRGPLPNPSPLTVALLSKSGAVWTLTSSAAELVTPIAAAILAALARFSQPPLTIERVGYAYNPHLPPTSLRLYLGKTSPLPTTSTAEIDTDWVAVIESHIDDMSGELFGGLMERLLSLGALDVTFTPLQMKKNRPATKITVIAPLEQGEYFSSLLLRETSTLGVRIQHVQRLKAQRSQQELSTPLGPILVKVKRLGPHIISASPEYESCRHLANVHNLPLTHVYELAQQAIQNLIIRHE